MVMVVLSATDWESTRPCSCRLFGTQPTPSARAAATLPLRRSLPLMRMVPLGFITPRRKAETTERAIDELGIVTEGPGQPVAALSGGNQQKVVMGRALASAPSVLVLMDPTAGVDVKSKAALLSIVARMREEGKAILVVSGELEDLRTCDRVLVMRHGAIVNEHPAGWTDNVLVASIEGLSFDDAE